MKKKKKEILYLKNNHTNIFLKVFKCYKEEAEANKIVTPEINMWCEYWAKKVLKNYDTVVTLKI